MNGEACTRASAAAAGWRLACEHPGEVLVLVHPGPGCRWQLRAHEAGHGDGVRAFKRARSTIVRGAVALWHAGHVTRYESAADAAQISFKDR